VSGSLLTLSLPAHDLSWLAWGSLIPLFFALEGKPPAAMFRLGLLAGFVHYLSMLYWTVVAMHFYGKIPIILSIILLMMLAMYLSLYVGIASWGIGRLASHIGFQKAVAAMPSLWVATEYMRSHLLTGFPWCLLGYSQYHNLVVVQMADLTGVLGISFVIVLVNACLFVVLKLTLSCFRKGSADGLLFPLFFIALTIAVIVGVNTYGAWRVQGLQASIAQCPKAQVGLVQGNIDQSQKWNPTNFTRTLETYQLLTRKAVQTKTDVIVWPETAVPGYYVPELAESHFMSDLSRQVESAIIFGSLSYERRPAGFALYNSAFMVSSHQSELLRYDKVHLVPFGEYVPLKPLLPFVDKLVEGIGEFSVGNRYPLFSFGRGTGGIVICYEAIFPQYARAYVNRGATVLVNITNDAWFGHTDAPYQHFAMAIMRAVENRVPLIRAANTGISAIVSPLGEVQDATPLFVEAFLSGTIPIRETHTVYSRYGDLIAVLVAGFALAPVFLIHVLRRTTDTI